MGIPIPGKDGLYIETGPWLQLVNQDCTRVVFETFMNNEVGQSICDTFLQNYTNHYVDKSIILIKLDVLYLIIF